MSPANRQTKTTTSNQQASSLPGNQACLPDISLQFKQSLPNTPKLQIRQQYDPAAKRFIACHIRQRTASAIRLLLKLPCNPDARDPAATAVQPRFTRGWRIHIFSIEFAIWRGRRRRPCVECAFYSHTRIGL
jgi:hypothetical protein